MPYVHLVFGARQTGKSTLLRNLLPDAAAWIDLSRPAERSEYARDPDRLPTVKSYYQLLEDLFIGFRVTAFSGSPRKSLLSTERFFFFDIGVRNAAAELPLDTAAVRANPGPVFEQWVGIELWKRLRYLGNGSLQYFRTKAGAEVDFILARGRTLIPVEVKWTETPSLADARHVLRFLDEHPTRARNGYLICRCATPLALSDRVTALPWWNF